MHVETFTTVCKPVVGYRDIVSEHEVELSWADGMIGVAPIFATRKQAEAYANGHDVVEINCLPLAEDAAP